MATKNEVEIKKNTLFGVETEFDGVLEFKNRLEIAGKFTGKINAPEGDLVIAKTSSCNVEKIEANSIVISGNVKGNMTASERVEICSGSVVEGDISTARIRIANNVDFRGDITMLEKHSDVDLFSVASAEFKEAMKLHSDVIK